MGENAKGDMSKVAARRKAPLETPTDLKSNAVRDLSAALTTLLADVFALYVKTKNFHWHMSGPHFRDYHLLRAPELVPGGSYWSGLNRETFMASTMTGEARLAGVIIGTMAVPCRSTSRRSATPS